MDLKSILEILRTVNKSDLTELEIEDKDFKIKIKKGSSTYQVIPQQVFPVNLPTSMNVPVLPQAQTQSQELILPSETKEEVSQVQKANTVFIKSPMIGTFYRSPAPDKDPYVKVGDIIRKGQVLCLIEAMKLFNEIESEVEGKIVKILVENAQPVEYDQPLFEVELG